MIPVAITLFVDCECGSSITIGAVVHEARCQSCGRVQALPPERWRALVDAAVNDVPWVKDGQAIERMNDATHRGRSLAKKVPARCTACNADVANESIQSGAFVGNVSCGACGAKLPIRPVPAELSSAFWGVTHFFAEEYSGETRYRAPDDDEDYDEDDDHRFYVLRDESIAPASPRVALRSVNRFAAVVGADGCVYSIGEDADAYVSGEDGGEGVVSCTDADGRTRWIQRGVPNIDLHSRIAWRADDALLIWNLCEPPTHVLDAKTGRVRGTLVNVDLRHVESAAAAMDSSLVFVKSSYFARIDATGAPLPPWPPRKGFLGRTIVTKPPDFEDRVDDAPYVEALDDYPTVVHDADAVMGWDGSLYVASGSDLASFDATGKKRYVSALPKASRVSAGRFGGDARGNAYVLMHDDEHFEIYSVLRDGAFSRIVREEGTRARLQFGTLIVRPNGTLTVLGSTSSRSFTMHGEPIE